MLHVQNNNQFQQRDRLSENTSDDSVLSGRNRQRDNDQTIIPNQFIVKLRTGTNNRASISTLESLKADLGITQTQSTTRLGFELWEMDHSHAELTPAELDTMIHRLRQNPLIEMVEANSRVYATTIPDDTDFDQLWGLNNTGQTGGSTDADIDAPESWNFTTGENVVVGVIDTGVDHTHPDLINNMWTNSGEIPDDGIDNDGNGFIDDYYGYDFANDDGDPFDDVNHGTHVAGTIAAEGNNDLGAIGVAPNAQIMAIKFLGVDGGTTFDAIQAIDYAVLMGADLTNNSWGNNIFSEALEDAIASAGAAGQLFVAAAGNNGTDNDSIPHYPSNYELSNVIAVAATTDVDELSSFSQYGATSVDLGAPGSGIYSAISGGGYASFNGTSMAAPHVTGVAALLLSLNPTLSPEELRMLILDNTDPIAALDGMTVSGGRLNAANAVGSVLNLASITGSKWHDINGDGIRDIDEPGLRDWTIYLDTNENGLLDGDEPSTLTDAAGNYVFNLLEVGTYTVAEVLQPGWTQTAPNIGSYTLDITDGQVIANIDFGNTVTNPATLSGQKWHDLNQNGQQDLDEPGLENWVIFLDENQNGTLDETEQSTLTDVNGQYTFTNVAPGTYTVAEQIQPGWQQVYPFVGIIEELFSADFSADDGSPSFDGFTIDNTGATVDGLWHLSTGRGTQPGHSPDDSIYFGQEENNDGGGNYDAGDTAGRITSPIIDLSGIEDNIELSFNYVLETEENAPTWDNARVLVSVDGGSFEVIASNAVEFQNSVEWTNAIVDLSAYAGSDIQIQFDFDTEDDIANTFEGWYIDDVEVYTVGRGTHDVTVGPDDVVTDLDFGNLFTPSSITGYKWHDVNQDGIWDADEPTLEGWTIYLDNNQNGQLDADEQFTVTDANGEYRFTNLLPGTYTVAEVLQPGWQQIYPFVGSVELLNADFTAEDGSASLDGFTIDNTGATVDGLWHLSTGRGDQPDHSSVDSFYFGQGEGENGGGNYDVGDTAGRITSPTIDLSGLDAAGLSFNYILETEGFAPNFDRAQVLISVDGGDFIPIASNGSELLDPTTVWTNISIDLSSYVDSAVQIQFDFDTGDSAANNCEGWYVDDVQVVGAGVGTHTVEVGLDEEVADINFGNVLLNQPPVAEDDNFSIFENGVLTENVLANDSNINDDLLMVSEVNGSTFPSGVAIALASGATVIMNSDGRFSYDPNGQFDGLNEGEIATDSFSYTIVDGEGMSDTATVSLTINGITDSFTLIGTPDEDDLVGTNGDDQIYGLGNNDDLRGQGGDDLIVGGGGDDSLYGNQGEDSLFGGSGDDFLAGGSDNDLVNGGSGGDHLLGNGGQDTLLGRLGNDFLAGGLDDDVLLGGAGDDVLRGNGGDDVLDGGVGNDQLFGGTGADQLILRSGDGLDLAFGFENGVDTFLLVEGLAFDQLDFTSSGTGIMIQDLVSGDLLVNVVGLSTADLGADDFVVA